MINHLNTKIMNIIKKIYFLSTIIFLGVVISCNDKDETPDPLVSVEIKNFEAPGDVYDYTTNPPVLVIENEMKYFDFSTEMEVTSSGTWDIGMKGTDIITNGGINGSGGVQATTISGIFDNLSEVPQGTTFASDTETANAINKNNDFEDRWYSYAAGIITPVPGKIILIKDSQGNYLKLEIQCYYKDCPTEPTPAVDNGVYTFRYIYQPNGTMSFD